MTRLAALVLLAAAVPQSVPLPDPSVTYSAQAAQAWIPFDRRPGGIIVIDVRIAGRPARALVDTGFTGTMLSRRYAVAHGLPLTPLGQGYSVGGVTRYDRTPAPDLEFGGIRATGGVIQVIDLATVDAYLDRPVDLVIGLPLLARYALQIDFDARRLRFLPSGTRPIAGSDVPVRLAKGPRALVPVQLGQGDATPLMLDLGSEQEVAIRPSVPLPRGGHETDLAFTGAGGVTTARLIGLDKAKMGDVGAQDVLVSVEGQDGFLRRNGLQGLVGIGLLGRYNLVLDVAQKRMTLAPRAQPETPLRSTTGIQSSGIGGGVDILHVMRGSPAAAAGLRAGDRVCGLNGRRLAPGWRATPLGHWGVSPPGTRWQVHLCDGRTVMLTAARFY